MKQPATQGRIVGRECGTRLALNSQSLCKLGFQVCAGTMAVSRVLEVLVMILVVVPLAYGQSSESEYDAWLAANQAKYQDSVTALGTPPAVGDFVTVAADSPPASPSCIRYVGKKGSGAKYSKVKSAVKSIPDGMTERCVIYVGEGVWE